MGLDGRLVGVAVIAVSSCKGPSALDFVKVNSSSFLRVAFPKPVLALSMEGFLLTSQP